MSCDPAKVSVTPPSPRRRLGSVLGGLPTLIVLAVLSGLAYWGHQTGWALPGFGSLGQPAGSPAEDWCAAHAVPESECVECHPEIKPPPGAKGWCKAHGVAECPLDHPEVAQVKGSPDVSPADHERATRALAFADRAENSSRCKLHQRRIQLASAEAADKLGLDVAAAWRGPVTESVAAAGVLAYDGTRVARLSSRAPGSLAWIGRQVGETVKQGEVVALVDAAEVGKAKAEFLQALVQIDLRGRVLDRMKSSASALPERQLSEAEAALREAEIRLVTAEQALANLGLPVRAEEFRALSAEQAGVRVRLLGLPEGLTGTLDPQRATATLLPVRAPQDGVVVAREGVVGEVIDPARVLFVVADLGRLWLHLDLRAEDARRVRVGQPVAFRPDGEPDEVTGAVAWVSPAVDEKTRTVKVRADLANPEGRLRALSFGAGRIVLREEKGAILAPREAVHWEGCCQVVFVRDKDYPKKGAPKVFHVRKVRTGAAAGPDVEIIAGVLPGEVLATKNSVALRGELLKNNLGAG